MTLFIATTSKASFQKWVFQNITQINGDVYRQLQTEFEMCVRLLHNGNKFACVPVGHSVIVKEYYLNVKLVLQKLRYSEHN